MVERRPWLTALSHAVLIVGVLAAGWWSTRRAEARATVSAT